MKIRAFLVILLMALNGCATNVSVDYDEKKHFPQLSQFAFKPAAETDQKDDLQLNSPLVKKRIKAALKEQLMAKGFEFSPDKPDFLVVYHTRVKQEIASHDSGVSLGFGSGHFGMIYRIPTNEVYSYNRGTLTIDILSADNKELLWRGSNSRVLNRSETPEGTSRMINTLVHEILKEFPPH